MKVASQTGHVRGGPRGFAAPAWPSARPAPTTGNVVAVVVLLLAACATAPPPPAPPPPPRPPPPAAEPEPEEPEEPPPPSTWGEAVERWGEVCPAPFFTLPTPTEKTVGGTTFTVHGSRWARSGPKAASLVIGVLGATKDATPETRANVKRAARDFKAQKVDVVLVNGDLVGGTIDDVDSVIDMLGETFTVPVLVHSGNSEWMSRYNAALAMAQTRWPQIVNLNFVREIDWSGIHLVSLPGYFNRRFQREGACHYDPEHVEEVGEWVTPYLEAHEPVIVTSHGPPQMQGTHGIDVIYDGPNVGDPALTTMLDEYEVPFGIFSHILEAGGRAVDAVNAPAALALPQKQPVPRLFVNVGASTAFPWEMLDGKTSRGMAAVFRVERASAGPAVARVTFLRLR
jgi:Icc-related predicted phosphoesterase